MPDLTLSLQDLHGDDAVTGFGFSDADLDIEEYPSDDYTAEDLEAMYQDHLAHQRRPVRQPLPTLPAALLAKTPRKVLRIIARFLRNGWPNPYPGYATRRYRRVALIAEVEAWHEAQAFAA